MRMLQLDALPKRVLIGLWAWGPVFLGKGRSRIAARMAELCNGWMTYEGALPGVVLYRDMEVAPGWGWRGTQLADEIAAAAPARP